MGGFSGGKPIAETDDATWDRMMNLNLRSGFNIFRAVIPRMRAAGVLENLHIVLHWNERLWTLPLST